MGVYVVTITRTQSGAIFIEADNAPDAERIALDNELYADMDTEDVQVDDVVELLGQEAEDVRSICITEE